MPRKKNRRVRLFLALRRITIIVLALLLVCSAVITVNDAAGWDILPTWHELFVSVGLAEAPVPSGELRVTFLDVGNADCILIQSGKQAVLIDAGKHGTANKVLQKLQLAGVERLDYVIATHADADHIGGMETLIRELEIGTFLMPPAGESEVIETQVYQSMLTALKEKGIPLEDAYYGFTCYLGTAQLKVITGRLANEDGNDGSAVCRLSFGENTFLFMSDAGTEVERELIREGVDIRADVIKVGHHGSDSSTDPQFIRLSRPTYAVITCGVDNPLGHPRESTLNTLDEYGVTVYRSDHHGDIVFTSDGTTLSVTTER